MKPSEKYGNEFFYHPFTVKKADGREFQCHDIGVCITPKQDAAITLNYAWGVLRELATWTCDEFKDRPTTETYRIVIAWSKKARENQGHIVKIWSDLAKVREVAGCITPEECSKRFGPGWTPFANWQKDVFEQKG
ncbi:MAG: hypothetical protein P4N60_15045 [Verrucomicrobiae bacterium]|nr:hypothetical protein [Verrucomicrobiae bacterium]